MRILSFIFIVIFAVSVSAQKDLVKQMFSEAAKAAQNAEYEKALEKFQKLNQSSKAEDFNADFSARIHFNVGVCLYRLGRNSEAVAEFNEAIDLSGGAYQKAFYALGMAETALKNWREAETNFREAVKLKPSDGEAWFDLGLVLLEDENFKAAGEAFQDSIRFKTVAASDAHNNLGVIYALKADFSSAEKEFETALRESNGESVEAENNLRFCKFYRQSFDVNLLAKLKFINRGYSV
jgi:Flp pilus assembly protein TadD